jgi:hypothetical protein
VQMLNMIASVGCFVCLVLVVIKMAQNEGVLKAVLGFICGIYAFIWGWMNTGRLGLKNVMLAWTVLILIAIVTGAMGGAAAFSGLSGG